MGLLDLKTDLKSLRYGQDTPGGGDSGQPYIKSKIPEGLTSKSPDFLLRNGYLAPRDALTDVARLTKMFFDLKSPNGLLFTAKQNVLSNSAVRTQTSGVLNEGIYTPLSTLAQAGVVAFGGHLNKQGVNPFEQTGAYANNGNLYATRIKNYNQEWLNSPDGSLKNRLFALYESKIQNNSIGLFSKINNISDLPSNILSYKGGPGAPLGVGFTSIRFADQRTGKNNPYSISGATTWTPDLSEQNNPDRSRKFLDILLSKATGVTNRYYKTNGVELLTTGNFPTDGNYVYESGSAVGLNAKLFNPNATGPVTWTPNQETLNSTDNLRRLISQSPTSRKFNLLLSGSNNDIPLSDLTPPSVYEQGPNQTILNNNDKILYANGSATYTQKQIEESPYGEGGNNINKKTGAPILQDFRRIIRKNSTLPNTERKAAEKNGSLAESLDYTDQNYEKRVNIGGKDNGGIGPGSSTNKNLSKGLLTPSGIGPIDKINALPIYRSENGVATNSEEEPNFGDTKNIKAPVNDLIAFRIAAINSGNPSILDYMHFRAFIDNFDDSYTADWGSTKYVGRGETFYNYNGFDRSISLGFTVVAQSLEELKPMYTKLNYLASNLTPDYSEFGYMRGPLIKLTVGKYLTEQVGFIKSLSYSIPQETPWDVNNEMPFMIKINSFNFVPIQSFRPSKQELTFDKAKLTGVGDQKYISFPNIVP